MNKRTGFLLLAVPFCSACWFNSTPPTNSTPKLISAGSGASHKANEIRAEADPDQFSTRDVFAEIENILYAPSPKDADFDERRAYHERAVERNPASAQKHFEYAQFLLDGALYSEADKELEQALKLDPNYPGSERLRGSINKVALEEPRKRDFTATSEFLDRPLEKVDLLPMPEEPGKTPEQVQAEATADVERDRAQLAVKYASLDRYEAKHDEFMRASVIRSYGRDGDWEGASRQFERVQKDYPDSPLAASVYAGELIAGSRWEEAGAIVSEARRKYPNDLALKVTADVLAEIQQSKRPPAFVGSDLSYRLSLVDAR